MKKIELIIVVVLSLLVILNISSVVRAASFQGLGHIEGRPIASGATAISDDGLVVAGYSGTTIGTNYPTNNGEAFRWTQSGGMVGLGDLPGGLFLSTAFCISGDGTAVGGASHSLAGNVNANSREGFRWTEATGMIGTGHSSTQNVVTGSSFDGSVMVGWAYLGNGIFGSFRWTDFASSFSVELQDAAACAVSNDGSIVAGIKYPQSSEQRAYRWTQADGVVLLGDLPEGGLRSTVNNISTNGSYVVGLGESESGKEAYRWTQSEGMVGLGDLPGGEFNSEAFDVSPDGSVVVGFGTADIGQEAFIWEIDNGMQNLKDLLVNDYGLDIPGWTLTNARSISADGMTIVGFGINPDGYEEAWIATIPEPATLSLLALGGLALRKRRKA